MNTSAFTCCAAFAAAALAISCSSDSDAPTMIASGGAPAAVGGGTTDPGPATGSEGVVGSGGGLAAGGVPTTGGAATNGETNGGNANGGMSEGGAGGLTDPGPETDPQVLLPEVDVSCDNAEGFNDTIWWDPAVPVPQRDAFTAPPAGCGNVTPGPRPLEEQLAAREVCPAVPLMQEAIEPNCPDANPNDNQPDDDALQACIRRGGVVALERGNPGYVLATGLTIPLKFNQLVLRGADPENKALIVAADTLNDAMLKGEEVSNVVVQYLELDGNREGRSAFLPGCSGYRIKGSVISLKFSRNVSVLDNEIRDVLCGSAIELDAKDFEVARNVVTNSGRGSEQGANLDAPEPWGDGITLHNCINGQVHDNHITNATDVGIVSGGNGQCSIIHNLVENTDRHVFAGIALHDFLLKGADHSGTVVAHNVVKSDEGMMAFGLTGGIHPWHNWPFEYNGELLPAPTNTGGTIACNEVEGANFNLMADGVDGLTITDNAVGDVSGNPHCRGPATPYVIGTQSNSDLSDGYVERDFDGCIPREQN